MPAPLATPAPERGLGTTAPEARAVASSRPLALPASRVMALAMMAWPFALIAAVAIAARIRYIAGFDGAYGSGDAHLVLTRALFISRGELEPPAALGASAGIFGNPPLIPLALAGFSKATTISLEHTPLMLGPLVALIGLFALYGVLTRALDRTVAIIGVVLVALLPRYAFDSTEPDKVIYVLSFFVVALFFLYEGQRRPSLYLAAGLFLGLSLFSHTTALLFAPVYLLSHIALSRGDRRTMLNGYFLASCAISVAFFALFVLLDDRYAPAVSGSGAIVAAPGSLPTATAPPTAELPIDALAPRENSGVRFVPSQIEEYWQNLRGLAERGFRDSAWNRYLDGIRDQILDPVYVFAIAGFALGAYLVLRRRRFEIAPLLLWMLIVTLGFAIQRPAASHYTRYPSYVTPVFIVMAVFFALSVARWVADRFEMQPAFRWALATPFLAYAAFSYATAPDIGLRPLYQGHHQLGAYATDNDLLNDSERILYLGWPSYTFALLNGGADEHHLETFGWQRLDPARFDLEDQRIRYYAYDNRSDDYYNNGGKMFAEIAKTYDLETVASFCSPAVPQGSECPQPVTLFRLSPKLP